MLQVPPTMAQSLTDVQVLPRMLQVPVAGQSDCCMQLLPVMLQAPGWSAQLASLVQLAPVMLHVPGFGVHTGGAQLVVAVQGFSGSGGRRLQPAGLYVTEHTGGWQDCVPGRLHTCFSGPLQVWGLVGQV